VNLLTFNNKVTLVRSIRWHTCLSFSVAGRRLKHVFKSKRDMNRTHVVFPVVDMRLVLKIRRDRCRTQDLHDVLHTLSVADMRHVLKIRRDSIEPKTSLTELQALSR
jgi:hypothetical protein